MNTNNQPYADSYDLIIKSRSVQEGKSDAWYWTGQPMRTLDAITSRYKREAKKYGKSVLSGKIVHQRLNQITGEVTTAVIDIAGAP